MTPNPLFDSRTEPENSKKYVFEQIFKHFLNFEPLLHLISGLNSKFDYFTLCVLNSSLGSQNFVLKSYIYQKLLRKNLWGIGSTPLDQEGLIATPLNEVCVTLVMLLLK